MQHKDGLVEGRAREEKAVYWQKRRSTMKAVECVLPCTRSGDRLRKHPMPGMDIQVLGEKGGVVWNWDQTTRAPLLQYKGGWSWGFLIRNRTGEVTWRRVCHPGLCRFGLAQVQEEQTSWYQPWCGMCAARRVDDAACRCISGMKWRLIFGSIRKK